MSLPLGRITEGAQAFDQKIKEATSAFSSNNYVSGTREFLTSNSIVAKFAFLIIVLLAFIILLRLGTSLISWFF